MQPPSIFFQLPTKTKIVPSAEVEADGLINLIGPSSGSSMCDVAMDIKSSETTIINDMNHLMH